MLKLSCYQLWTLLQYRDAAFHSKADHYIPKDSFMRLVDLIRADAHISDGGG